MIISCVQDPALEAAVALLAREDEDLFPVGVVGTAPMRHGFPRLVVYESDLPIYEAVRVTTGPDWDVPTAVVTAGTLARWRFERRTKGGAAPFAEDCAERLKAATGHVAGVPWVDRMFRDMERVCGAPLPAAFRGFARRVVEYPAFYASLSALASRVGLSSGALQGRFFRRRLRSPSEHLRWLRLLALSAELSRSDTTLGSAASRFGYTSAGNLCRGVQHLVGKSPSELRKDTALTEITTRFGRAYLGSEGRDGWSGLGDIFCGIEPVRDAHTSLTA